MVNNTHNTESSTQISKPHELRTAAEPRQDSLYRLRVSHVSQVNPTIRLIRFNVLSTCSSLDWAETDHESTLDKAEYPPFRFSPGQWLDVHIPNIRHAGGFTITSTPRDVSSQIDTDTGLPHIELAVQYSATNPAAKWFWKPAEQILNTHVKVRVGGAFVWPPPNNMPVDEIKNAIFVAGGVGIKYVFRPLFCCQLE
ncbi:hypothetical protein FQN49_002995 [Arthroderma sp. PD_2]|nr:hypothetical protein FQN49_002995 [Arthroderma sp. PD_2]